MVINSSGDLALNLEGKLFTRIPADLRVALSSAAINLPIALTPVRVRTHVSSMSRSRMPLYTFTISTPGAYTLRIEGVDVAADYSDYAIVISRQFSAALVLHIMALIALGFALIGSLVVSGLILSGKSFSPAVSSSYDPGSPSP